MGYVPMNSDYMTSFVKFCASKLEAIEVGLSESLRDEYTNNEDTDVSFDYVIRSAIVSSYVNGLIDCYMAENANPSDEYATELRRYIVTLSNQLRGKLKEIGKEDRRSGQDPRCN